MYKIIPGLILTLVFAVFITVIHGQLPQQIQSVVGPISFGLFIGMLGKSLLNFIPMPQAQPGLNFCQNQLLKLAIILLGFGMSVQNVLRSGRDVFSIILINIFLILVVVFLFTKTKVLTWRLASLIGIGSAICGNTAISALAPSIEAKQNEISFAITVNTLMGTMAVLVYPLLAHYWQLDDQFFGRWVGLAVNDTSQVLAAASNLSGQAADIATSVKLTRNALMAPVLALTVAFLTTTQGKEQTSWVSKLKIPPFIIYFVLASILNSLGLVSYLELKTGLPLGVYVKSSVHYLMLLALIAVGLNTSLKNLASLGIKPILVGIICAVMVSTSSFLCLTYLN